MIRSRRILSVLAVAVVGGIIAVGAAPALALGPVPDSAPYVVRGKVFAMAETSDHATIYLGGTFSRASDQSGKNVYFPFSITRFNEATGAGDPTWLPSVYASDGSAGTVNALALSPDDSTLYVAGKFAFACPAPTTSPSTTCPARTDLAAFDTTTGAVQSISANISNNVDALLLGTDGSGNVTNVYIGGSFKRVNSKPVVRLADLIPDGSGGWMVNTAWEPQANNTVRTLKFASDGESIFVGGGFDSITDNGTVYPRQSVARINLDGTLNDWAITNGTLPTPMTAWSLSPSPDGNTLYGGFGAGPNFAAAFCLQLVTCPTGGSVGDQIWRHNMTGNVEGTALAPDGLHLFISGHFGTAHKAPTVCTGVLAHGIAELNLTGTKPGSFVCWAPHMYPDHDNFTGGWTLLANPTYLWVAGSFDGICTPDGVTQCVPASFTPTSGKGTMSIARFTL